jgi:hypothetical protein
MNSRAIHMLQARGIRAGLDLALGQLAIFEVHQDGRKISPFARVPWADGPDDPARFALDMAPHLRRMSRDFFCAPFCADDVEGAPAHGWTANSAWDLIEEIRFDGGVTARFRLQHRIAGAVVEKVWTLRDDHPFLYQEHRFIGGTGSIPVAHHAMLDLREGGLLQFSPKLWAETPGQPLEKDRSVLQYPAESMDMSAFPSQTGPADLTRYPIGAGHEDFVMLIDDPAQKLGWVTALRPASRDIAVMVKAVSVLPQTMLWFSNGGRAAAPWNGEHVGVLGIEEACALGIEGWAASTTPNRLTARGIATAIDLGKHATVSIATAMGSFACAARTPQSLALESQTIRLDDGTVVPFHSAHFG